MTAATANKTQTTVSGDGSVLLLTSERFIAHVTPTGHPEQPDRAEVMAAVARRWAEEGGVVASPDTALIDDLLLVHDQSYVDAITSMVGHSVYLDPDTYASPESGAVAKLAAGASVGCVDYLLDHGGRALAFVRPPGHHAERNRAMGFCLFNNVGVAAAHALSRGVDKVAIVDYDVHHGNGTQWMFYDDPRVLYVSTHQYPFYPGTGAATDVGCGDGVGYTVNIPLQSGAGDADYAVVFRSVVAPVLHAFDPDLILLSAGYDAHDCDPLGAMRLTTKGYTGLTASLRLVAEACCEGRIAVVTEGGYDLSVLEECLTETLMVMREKVPTDYPFPSGSSSRGETAVEAVTRVQVSFWPTL